MRNSGLLFCCRLVVLGPALTGKTAQCARLSSHFDCPHVSAGELLHAEVQARSELGLQAEALLNKSKTVPDALVLQLVVRRLQQADCQEQGWVLDGFPHTQAQVGPRITFAVGQVDCFSHARATVLTWFDASLCLC